MAASKSFEYGLCVIGGGSGGVRAARIAATHGAKVILAEEDRMGGTCVIRGCVPKKLYVYASRFADAFHDAEGFGWTVTGETFDFTRLKAAKDKEIMRLEGLYKGNLTKAGVEIVAQRAVITGPNSVKFADGREITTEYILVATGSAPYYPSELPHKEHIESSNDIFNWETLPKSCLIVGAGYIAVEFGCLLQKLGCKITLCCRQEYVLSRFDEDLRKNLTEAMRVQGINVLTKSEVHTIEKKENTFHVTLKGGEAVEVEHIVYATGRKPNSKKLGLEDVGVTMDDEGGILVDRYSRTNVSSIYAVGDVTNRVQLTPAAIREGHAFADSVFGGKKIAVDLVPVPTAVFSTPELGTVGLTEADAKRAGHQVVLYKTSFRAMKATLSGSAEKVFMKIIVDKSTDRVLGVHVLGEAAGEMVQLLGICVRMGATKAQFDETLAVHPTAAEELVTMRTPWTPS